MGRFESIRNCLTTKVFGKTRLLEPLSVVASERSPICSVTFLPLRKRSQAKDFSSLCLRSRAAMMNAYRLFVLNWSVAEPPWFVPVGSSLRFSSSPI